MLVRTRSDLRTLESRIARAMDRLCRDVQGWADETMPLQANQWFFFNLIFCREKAQRTQIAREKVRDANKSWTLAMQKSNEVVRRQRLSGGSDPEELLHVQTCAANVKSAEQIFNNRREDLQFHILRQKETESSFLTNDGVKALTESGLRTPSSPVSSNEDMSYYIDGGGDDQQPIPEDPPRHPLLMRVETTRRELARGIQMLQKKIEAYSRGVANYSVIKSSGAKEAWDVDYKKRSKYDIETFREKMEKAIEKADIAYQKARKDALEAGILESELPLTPSGLAGEADEKTKKIVSRDSNASDLKGRVTWDDKRDRRRIRKWGRKVARGRVEKSSPESPARFPITSPARSIGSIGPPSPWENPNIRWIRRENETRRRLREQAGKLREKKRREVAREHLRNGGRQQELVKRDPWTDEMEDVQFGMAGEDSIYGGPDSEPDGGEGWRKATETTNPLRLPLYPSAADRRRRRRPQA
ncbi:hypothetical protein HII31_13494 [Pseudocercospora fuligena]|uniref:Uncharacterized protein n=1 Tax=Pseudocercospora fuligena TaxID=685502 RepID=A0A8H6VEH8_9PEZI|nr:hypothetical protein HII31_13494 [Pseudocercospora fuligena]